MNLPESKLVPSDSPDAVSSSGPASEAPTRGGDILVSWGGGGGGGAFNSALIRIARAAPVARWFSQYRVYAVGISIGQCSNVWYWDCSGIATQRNLSTGRRVAVLSEGVAMVTLDIPYENDAWSNAARLSLLR